MKKTIGFIDLYINNWHANNYPAWFRTAKRADEFELGYAYEETPAPGSPSLEDWCEKNGIKRARYNTVVNKTPISYKANRMIGGHAPSIYLEKLQTHEQVQLADAQMNTIVESHLIDANTLRADDFDNFYKARKAALVKLIERAMGKAED